MSIILTGIKSPSKCSFAHLLVLLSVLNILFVIFIYLTIHCPTENSNYWAGDNKCLHVTKEKCKRNRICYRFKTKEKEPNIYTYI